MTPKKYITEITAKDMQELAEVTNMEPGFLVNIDRVKGKLVISIDKTALAQAINGFYRNGGCFTGAAEATDVSFDPLN